MKTFLNNIPEVTEVREGENEVSIDLNSDNTFVVADIVQKIDEFIGNKNQNIYVERFDGIGSTTILIENPILRDRLDGTVVDLEDRDRSGYENIITEINVHELVGSAELHGAYSKIQSDR